MAIIDYLIFVDYEKKQTNLKRIIGNGNCFVIISK